MTFIEKNEVGEVVGVLLTMVFALVILLAAITLAFSHDNRLTQHKRQDGTGCCGAGACQQVTNVATANNNKGDPGYVVGGVFIPAKITLPSEDGKFWLCKHAGVPVCFFAPTMGY